MHRFQMRILIAYYSRSGYTAILAERIAQELRLREHTVVLDRLHGVKKKSKWNPLFRQIYQYPIVALSVITPRFRRWWLAVYPQPEDDIQPPAHPDVSGFDHVCIGGPKWCYIAYPVARYLRQVRGLCGKKVSAFSTFGGPPLEVFELELLFQPFSHRVQRSGGLLIPTRTGPVPLIEPGRSKEGDLTMARLSETAKRVRQRIMDQVLADGTCPKGAEISRELSLSREELGRILKDLEAAICVAVQTDSNAHLESFQEEELLEAVPEPGEIFYARPFAAFRNHYPVWVNGEQKWYGECAVEACGVSAMFPGREVIVRSVCRQTQEPVELIGRDGILLDYSPKSLRLHIGFPLKCIP